jgi:hypothetical protein
MRSTIRGMLQDTLDILYQSPYRGFERLDYSRSAHFNWLSSLERKTYMLVCAALQPALEIRGHKVRDLQG